MALLTAYNEDVQNYIETPSTQTKKAIINEIKENALTKGINFNSLFPRGTKRYQVLDTIVYMLSGGGICKVSSKTLAAKVGASVRTVKEAVAAMKELDDFIVGGLADGKNKYIFVYKNHEDFTEILASVFYLNSQQIAQQTAQQRNVETIDNKEVKGLKVDSIHYSNSLLKQEKDSIRDSIENEVITAANEKEKAKEYLINPYQKRLYMVMKDDSSLHNEISRNSLIISLRAGSNLDETLYNKALVAVRKLDKHLALGGSVESVPAVFDKIYRDRIKYSDYYKAPTPKTKRDTSFYYNWINNND